MHAKADEARRQSVRRPDVPAPAFTVAPAELGEIIRDRREHVGMVRPDVGPSGAAEADRVFEEARWHELALSHRAGPRAAQLRRRNTVALHDAQRRDQLAREQRGAASVVSERGERRNHRIVAGEFAEVGLDAPQRDDKARLYMKATADAIEQVALRRQMLLDAGTTLLRRQPAHIV